jgi:hypothetical protein
MGLDMFLSKKIYIGANYDFENVKATIHITKNGTPIDINPKKIKYIVEEQAYWRKANQIHRWFVDNVQGGDDDCKPYEVSGEQLLELVKLCKKVLKNKELAEELLPTQEGFFFGNTNYDEYYYQDLIDTIKQLKDVNKDYWYIYQASW